MPCFKGSTRPVPLQSDSLVGWRIFYMKGGGTGLHQTGVPSLPGCRYRKKISSGLLSILIKPVWGSHMHQWVGEGLFFMPELAAYTVTAKSQTFASRSQQIQLMVWVLILVLLTGCCYAWRKRRLNIAFYPKRGRSGTNSTELLHPKKRSPLDPSPPTLTTTDSRLLNETLAEVTEGRFKWRAASTIDCLWVQLNWQDALYSMFFLLNKRAWTFLCLFQTVFPI